MKTFGAKAKLLAASSVDDNEFKVEAAVAELDVGNERIETVKMHQVVRRHVTIAMMAIDNNSSCSSMRLRRRCMVGRNFGLEGSDRSNTFGLLLNQIKARQRAQHGQQSARREGRRRRVVRVHECVEAAHLCFSFRARHHFHVLLILKFFRH